MKLTIVALVLLYACGGGDSESSAPPDSKRARPQITSEEVVRAFEDAGLEAESSRPMTIQDFGAAPMKTDDATRFLIPSLGKDSGGRAFVFESIADLQNTKNFYEEVGEESALLFSWTFANEEQGVLVQINGELPKAKAQNYGEVVGGL